LKILLKFSICGFFSSLLFPPFFILPLGFIVFPYLFLLLINKKFLKKNRIFQFNAGLVFGITMNFFVLFWIKEPFLVDKSTSNFALFSYLLIIYCSLYFGLIFLLLSFINNYISKLILIPILFVCSEIIRENFLYGFPWISFAVIYSGNFLLINLIYYLGNYGLSYFVILIFIFPAALLLLSEKKITNILLSYIIISIVIFLIGFTLIFLRFYSDSPHNKLDLNISIAQLNISQIEKNKKINLEDRLKQISNIIDNNISDLIIFAENDFPYLIQDLDELVFLQKKLKVNQSVVIGGIKKENSKYYNSFFLIEKFNIQNFHKIKLVPFGEFLPLRRLLFFLEPIVGNNDFSSGTNYRLINTSNNLSIVPIICYEIIFSNKLLNENNVNSDLLINITNDSWFGDFSGPYQHFYLSKMRAVEFNKPLIRVSNNGVSAIVSNKGKIIEHIPLNKKNILNKKISIPYNLPNLIKYHNLIYIFLTILFIFSLVVNKKVNE